MAKTDGAAALSPPFFHIGIGEKAPNRYVESRALKLRLSLNQYNGKYTLDSSGMEPHTTGALKSGKSQFLYKVNEKQLVLDSASIADQGRTMGWK